MVYQDIEGDVPHTILTALEDLTADIVDLQQLVLMLAGTTEFLPRPKLCQRPDTLQ